MAGAVGAITVTTFNIVDLIGVTATPSNPTTGKGRLYYDPVGKALDCLNPDGTACTFGSGGGGAPGGSIGDIQFNNGAGAFTNAVGIHSGATARLSNLTGAMTLTASGGMNFTAGTTMNFSSVGTLTMASSGAAALLEGSSASLVGDSAGVTITATSNFIRLNGVGVVNQINGSASNPAESFSGTAFTGGSGTTTFPLILVGGGAAVTTWSTAGTYIGFDADSGFTGNFFDAHVNGGASVAKLTSTGALTVASCSGCTSISFPQTVAGTVTSGGIPYFNSTTSMSSSAAGTVNTLMKWGGAGNPPIASSLTDNGTIVATTEPFAASDGTANCSSPGYQFSAVANTGVGRSAVGMLFCLSGGLFAAETSQGFSMHGTVGEYGFASGTPSATNDTGISRASAGVVEVGNGTVGNASGGVIAATLSGTTSVTAGGFTPVSIGTPVQVYNTATTSSAASIGATTMIANPAADRNYRFNVYIGQVAQGTTCTIAGSVAISLIYTDPITGNAYTYVVPLDVSGGTALGANIPLATGAPAVANVGSGVIRFRAKASTNIQYSTTYAQGTCSSGSPTYSVYPVLEAL